MTPAHMDFHLLTLEDDEEDTLILSSVCARFNEAQSELTVRLRVCSDRNELEYWLEHFSETGRRGLVLLDVDLGKSNGLNVLDSIKRQAHGCGFPVVIHTSSSSESDRQFADLALANAYVLKSCVFDTMYTNITSLIRFFGLVNHYPMAGTRRQLCI